jgi:transcriptional regulator with XRE-family HTH domain
MGPITVMFLARRRAGYSQQEVARRIGVTQPKISAWENRTADVPKARRRQIADLLGVDPDTLTDDA